MGYGDEIIAAGQAQRLLEQTAQPSIIVDRHGNPRWHPIWDGNPAVLAPTTPPPLAYHTIRNGPHCRPYIESLSEDTGWTFNKRFHAREHIARIYLTPAERAGGQQIYDRFGPFILVEPYSKHSNLRWPLDHWNELVSRNRHLTFIQHTHQHTGLFKVDDVHYVHTESFRDACGLLAAASLYIRGESGMCHAAAALDVPQITIWGACMDWDVLGGYPRQYGVGIGDPCGSYRHCYHCERTMAGISAERVSVALTYILDAHGTR